MLEVKINPERNWYITMLDFEDLGECRDCCINCLSPTYLYGEYCVLGDAEESRLRYEGFQRIINSL